MFLANPVLLFITIWMTTLGLYSLHLSSILTEIKIEAIVLVLTSAAVFFIAYILYFFSVTKPIIFPTYVVNKYAIEFENKIVKKRIKYLIYFWLFMSFIELIVATNFPFLSLLGFGNYVNYVNFGIGGLHGLLNAIFLFLACYFVIKYKSTNENKYLFILFLMFLWPILLMTRQLLLSFLIEILFIHLITVRISFFRGVKIFFAIMAAIILFGLLGDLRSNREFFIAASSPTFQYPEYLPSGFLWVYMYITSPLNNINNSINIIDPLYFPFHTVASMLPSFLRDGFTNLFDIQKNSLELVTDTFNVSSFFDPFLLDFGLYAIHIPLFILAIISLFVMHRAQNNIAYVFILAIMLHSIVMTIFANFITHIIFIMQMVLAFFIFNMRRIKF